jgi:hypothetical protein
MRRIPRPLEDIKPSQDNLNHFDSAGIPSTRTTAQSRIQRVLLMLRDTLQTTFNSFGLCRLYPRRPSFEPDQFISSMLLARTSPTTTNTEGTDSPAKVFAPPYPFPNSTTYRLMSWVHSGSSRVSETKVLHLVRDVILAEDFDHMDLENFSVK